MSADTEWRRCSVCNEEWPASAFRAGGSAYDHRKNVCGACYEERHPRRVVPCSGCGKRMETRGKFCAPKCRTCREREVGAHV